MRLLNESREVKWKCERNLDKSLTKRMRGESVKVVAIEIVLKMAMKRTHLMYPDGFSCLIAVAPNWRWSTRGDRPVAPRRQSKPGKDWKWGEKY
jgi:hypothetical protein